MEERVKLYYTTFRRHFYDIHWGGMDITMEEVASILGISANVDNGTEAGNKKL